MDDTEIRGLSETSSRVRLLLYFPAIHLAESELFLKSEKYSTVYTEGLHASSALSGASGSAGHTDLSTESRPPLLVDAGQACKTPFP